MMKEDFVEIPGSKEVESILGIRVYMKAGREDPIKFVKKRKISIERESLLCDLEEMKSDEK